AGVDAVVLPLDVARGLGALDEPRDVDAVLGEVEERAALAVLADVGHVHLDDVGRGVAGGLGGEPVPVAGPLAGLLLDRDARVGLDVGRDHVARVGVADLVAPPRKGEPDAVLAAAATATGPAVTTAAAPGEAEACAHRAQRGHREELPP